MSYTVTQVAALTNAAPVSFADAQAFAAQWNVSTKSVISKVKNLDLPYIPKPKAAKKVAPVTKAQLVAQISVVLGVNLDGLVASKADALVALLDAVSPVID